MKTYKSTQNGLDIIAKFTEVKGDENMVDVKVYIKISGTTNKKVFLPKNFLDEKFCLSTDEERKDFVKQNHLKINWFLEGKEGDKFDKTGTRLITPRLRGQINFPFYWSNFYLTPRYEIWGINTAKDYYTFNISKDDLMKYPIVLKIVKKGENWWELDDNFEPWVVVSIDASKCIVSGQRRANRSGFNSTVARYLKIFGGLKELPKFESEKEMNEWYSTLTQNQADSVRRAARNYNDFSAGEDITPRQLKFIQENGEEYMKMYGWWKEGVWSCTKQLASAIIDTISQKTPATDKQKNFILKMDSTYDVTSLSKSEATKIINNLINLERRSTLLSKLKIK